MNIVPLPKELLVDCQVSVLDEFSDYFYKWGVFGKFVVCQTLDLVENLLVVRQGGEGGGRVDVLERGLGCLVGCGVDGLGLLVCILLSLIAALRSFFHLLYMKLFLLLISTLY